MGKSSDELRDGAKAGLCAAGLCCALCIGIPLLIIIIIIIIVVVMMNKAADTVTSGFDSLSCSTLEASDGACSGSDLACKGARTCDPTTDKCTGTDGCWAGCCFQHSSWLGRALGVKSMQAKRRRKSHSLFGWKHGCWGFRCDEKRGYNNKIDNIMQADTKWLAETAFLIAFSCHSAPPTCPAWQPIFCCFSLSKKDIYSTWHCFAFHIFFSILFHHFIPFILAFSHFFAVAVSDTIINPNTNFSIPIPTVHYSLIN